MAGVLQSPDLKTGRKEERAERRALPFTYFLLPSVLDRSLIQNQVKARSRWELLLLPAGSGAASVPSACLLQPNATMPRARGLPAAGDGAEEGCPLTSAAETPGVGVQPL